MTLKICSCPAGIHQLKVSDRNTRTRCEIYSKLTIKIPERRLFLCTRPVFPDYLSVSYDCDYMQLLSFDFYRKMNIRSSLDESLFTLGKIFRS